jgi:hypothetical protein
VGGRVPPNRYYAKMKTHLAATAYRGRRSKTVLIYRSEKRCAVPIIYALLKKQLVCVCTGGQAYISPYKTIVPRGIFSEITIMRNYETTAFYRRA